MVSIIFQAASSKSKEGIVSFGPEVMPGREIPIWCTLSWPAVIIPKSKKTTSTETERRHPRPSLKVEKIWKESIDFLTGFGRFGICFTSVLEQS